MAKDEATKPGSTKPKSGEEHGVAGAEPAVVAHVVHTAKEEGLPPEVAKDIAKEGLAEGVAPEKLQEVADEAVRVEREDRDANS